ncbi:hypothetical protein CR513_25840, partial [Mucuna pruriens]
MDEGYEQAGMNNTGGEPPLGTGIGPTQGSGIGPILASRVGPYMQQVEEKLHLLEERLWVIEGTNRHDLDTVDLCLVPDVGLPADYKTSKFKKCKGSSCPRVHLAIWRPTYMKTRSSCIASRTRDLVEAFLKQYKYNKNMAPDRSHLQNLSKREQEGFKEYAKR